MTTKSSPANWEKIAGFAFACIFLIALLIITLMIPDPTPTQHATFRTILALAAAGATVILPGSIAVKSQTKALALKAGGALGIFIVVYLLDPAAPKPLQKSSDVQSSVQPVAQQVLATPKPLQKPSVAEPSVQQTIESGGIGVIHTGEGDNVIENNHN